MSDLEQRLQAVEEWIAEFERGAEEAEREIEAILGGGDIEIEFIPCEDLTDLLRDKKKDN